ncbi:hypothetical protein SLA_2168 [Streptomyces laurentii]|uniref:Uncharacterized protein n=1 Tax=Streptomyces laurentii TaxID=39478 RepID=A0A160NYS1_STRLU|nr:hypothetical protein SLA_2168 [Streptomyces laurentii]
MPDHNACPNPEPAPIIGTYMVDTLVIRPGRVMAREGDLYFLRPVGGGCEWTARAEDLRPPGEHEHFRALPAPVVPR